MFVESAETYRAPDLDDIDTDYWERRLPEEMLGLSPQIPSGQKFDPVDVEEVKDFADAWWEVLLSAPKDPEEGRIYVSRVKNLGQIRRLGVGDETSAEYV